MKSEFVALIDEAGCSGGKFGKGSSEYLVMVAVVVRRCNLDNALAVFDEARAERCCEGKTFRKFSKSNDKDNFVITKLLGRKPIRTAYIGFHKPSLAETHIRKNHGNEYQYLSKFMIERISWAVRDAEKLGGNQKCDLIFSQQDMYDLSEFTDYVTKLRLGRGRYNTRANWEHIGNISEEPHADEGPTHLADSAASSFHMPIEPKLYGMTDERFFLNLSQATLYRGREGKPFGLKMWPEQAIKPAKELGRLRFLDVL